MTDATGIVHNACVRRNDARGLNYDLPFVQMVDEKSRFKSARHGQACS